MCYCSFNASFDYSFHAAAFWAAAEPGGFFFAINGLL
jgi:hypothetical protein